MIKNLLLLYKYRHNYHRSKMVNMALEYCRSTGVTGDYFEFGVYRGTTFSYAFHAARLRKMRDMRFHAFDSFEGFSAPIAAEHTGVIKKGGRSCSQDEFRSNLERSGVDMRSVTMTPGFFSDSLLGRGRGETIERIGNSRAAIVYMDCDLYEPTYEALTFIRDRLIDGSVIILDNWFLFRGSPHRGERKAFERWAKENPDLILTPFRDFGWCGASYIVTLPSAEESEK